MRLSSTPYFIRCLLFLIVLYTRRCSNVDGASLKCKVCAINQSGFHQDTGDNQRISYESPKPYCRRFETVECDRNQDTCITVVQQIESKNSRSYLILKGCSYKWKYPKTGCTTKAEHVHKPQIYEFGRRERPVSFNQATETCVCDYDSCNKGWSLSKCRLRILYVVWLSLFVIFCLYVD